MAAPRMTGAMHDVLALLLEAWNEKREPHGWLIMKSLRRSGPAVYSALDRLEDKGWITGTWEVLPEGERRARRRYYRLTATGVEAARSAVAESQRATPQLRPQPGFGMVLRPSLTG
ncbi:PadR family transcriptional regulator [Micromonospora sp. CPCC 206061]|uniref:PadR family transcriptional regulator n=1 Tax=Micromonospora sp. CPCC 206061 TaxID=3122410 RepID=UPI002FF23D8E